MISVRYLLIWLISSAHQARSFEAPENKHSDEITLQHIRHEIPTNLKTIDTLTLHGNDQISASSLNVARSTSLVHQNTQHELKRPVVCSTVLEYITAIGDSANSSVLFHWNSTGSLMNYSPSDGQYHAHWLTEDLIQNTFIATQPSKYGTAALLINNDVIRPYHWEFIPPIPVLMYTIPKDITESLPNIIVVPNPYDSSGLSENQIISVENYFKGSNENDGIVSFDEFKQRQNAVIWRGSVRRQEDRKLLTQMSSNHTINPDGWLDAVDTDGNTASHMSLEDMSSKYRYQIDVGGCSGTAWNGLRWKMCASGGVVFKVDTFAIDWWHQELEPWVHYIPVKSDLSDLRQKYEWAEQNLDLVYNISVTGRHLCSKSYTKNHARNKMIDIVQNLSPLKSKEMFEEVSSMFETRSPRNLFEH